MCNYAVPLLSLPCADDRIVWMDIFTDLVVSSSSSSSGGAGDPQSTAASAASAASAATAAAAATAAKSAVDGGIGLELNPRFKHDGTHLHPVYVELLERELNKLN